MSNDPGNFLFLLLKNRVFIVKVVALVMIITIPVTFLLPKKYTVETVILPPEDQPAGASAFGGMSMGDFAGFFGGGIGYSLPLMTTLSDVYVEILNSRTLIDQVILGTAYIDSLKFTGRYEREPEVAMFLARKEFNKNYSASVTSSGLIALRVTSGDPMYSVELSNRVVFLLDSINTSVTLARYGESREIIENQLAVAEVNLENTTAALLLFEEEYGTIRPDFEIEELIVTLTELKSRYIETSFAVSAIKNGIRSGTTTQILELEARADALRNSIQAVESGSSVNGISLGIDIRDLPPAVLEYAKLKTDFEVQLRMVSTLRIQAVQALIQEENIVSSLRLLDPPRHPGWKSKPKKIYIWLQVFLLTVVFLAVFLFSRERWYKLRREYPEDWNKWNELKQSIRNDFKRKKTEKK